MSSYDAWKLASPDDERRDYDCDVCGKPSRDVEQCWTTTGLETWACPACRGDEEEEEEIEYCPKCARPPVGLAPPWPYCNCPKY
jgi:hypothetical protein